MCFVLLNGLGTSESSAGNFFSTKCSNYNSAPKVLHCNSGPTFGRAVTVCVTEPLFTFAFQSKSTFISKTHVLIRTPLTFCPEVEQ